MKSKHILSVALALLLAFVVAAFPLERDTLSSGEARALWLISDEPLPPQPSSLRLSLTRVWDSLVTTYQRTRAEAEFVLYYPPLNVWQSFMSDSFFITRVPSAWFALLAMAAVFAVIKHLYNRRIAFYSLAFLALISIALNYPSHMSPHSLVLMLLSLMTFFYMRWRGLKRRSFVFIAIWTVFLGVVPLALPQYRNVDSAAITQAAETRQADEPALTLITPQNPIFYYARREGFIEGISLDLGWRTPTIDEVRGYVATLATVPRVWLIMPEGSNLTSEAIVTLVNEGYTIGYEASSAGLLIYRFDRE